MIKSELINSMTEELPYLNHKDAQLIVNEIIEKMSISLSQGDNIEIRGFGSFKLRRRRSRDARNPKTHQIVKMLSKYVVHFSPGKDLREKVNAGRQHYPIRED